MQEIFSQSLSQLVSFVVYMAALTLISYVGMLIKKFQPVVAAWLDTNTTAAQKKLIKELGQEAFVYAETVFKEKNGSDKLHEALAFFQKNMSKYNLPGLTYENIRNAVEQAWLADKSLRTFDVEVDAGELETVVPAVDAQTTAETES